MYTTLSKQAKSGVENRWKNIRKLFLPDDDGDVSASVAKK